MAYSGGRDSTALLHATLAVATPLGLHVVALHVHHGLSPNADDWVGRCAAQCMRWRRRHPTLRFMFERLTSPAEPGESVEAWARRGRYAALRRMAADASASLVLLAHHRRDQAETFLLQALRGGGVAGLSGMPRSAEHAGLTWSRPWLEAPTDEIAKYARRHRLRWIEDESNVDPRLARSRLRLQVWPALVAAFGDAETTLSTAARWAQAAADTVAERAHEDLLVVATARGLQVAAWQALSPARRSHALRAWLSTQLGHAAPASLVSRLSSELATTDTGRWPLPRGELYRYRDELRWKAGPALQDTCRAVELSVHGPGRYAMPAWGGILRVEAVARGGIAHPTASRLQFRDRVPTDRFQLGPGRPPRRLKLQFQSIGVAEPLRRVPVICCGEQMVYVPGLGVDARVVAAEGQPQFMLVWCSEPASAHDDPSRVAR